MKMCYLNFSILFLIFCLQVNTIFSQIGSLNLNDNKKSLKKLERKIKKDENCSKIEIILDTNQYVCGIEKEIYYFIKLTYTFNNQEYHYTVTPSYKSYLNSTKDLNKIKIVVNGIKNIPKSNRIIIKKDLSNSNSTLITIKAELKANKNINDVKHLDIINRKNIKIGFVGESASNIILPNNTITRINGEDGHFIKVYLKKSNNLLTKNLIYFTLIDSSNVDTLKYFADTSSTIILYSYAGNGKDNDGSRSIGKGGKVGKIDVFLDPNVNLNNIKLATEVLPGKNGIEYHTDGYMRGLMDTVFPIETINQPNKAVELINIPYVIKNLPDYLFAF